MSEIVDLTAERNKREAPDPEFIRKDDFGRPLYCFLLSYEYDNARWSTEVWGYDMADADARVAAMRESLKLDGQLFTRMPA